MVDNKRKNFRQWGILIYIKLNFASRSFKQINLISYFVTTTVMHWARNGKIFYCGNVADNELISEHQLTTDFVLNILQRFKVNNYTTLNK